MAIDNPLFSLPDPTAVTDVVRFLADDGRSYYVVQAQEGGYTAYVVEGRQLRALEDGTYPLPAGRTFEVKGGSVADEAIGQIKVFAHRSTRLPL